MVAISKIIALSLAAEALGKEELGHDPDAELESMLAAKRNSAQRTPQSSLQHDVAIRPSYELEVWSPVTARAHRLSCRSLLREIAPDKRMKIQPFLGNQIDQNSFSSLTFNSQPAGIAASIFQDKYQDQVLKNPGTLYVTRSDLGIDNNHMVMVDVGGEGQKTSLEGIKSGSVHAINLNVQQVVSSVPVYMHAEPDTPMVLIENGKIPNLIRPAQSWPLSTFEMIRGFYPIENGFSDFTLMEGAPLTSHNMHEILRVTDPKGWVILNIHNQFESQAKELAQLHNGGEISSLPRGDGITRFIIPPKHLSEQTRSRAYADLHRSNSHNKYDIIKSYRS